MDDQFNPWSISRGLGFFKGKDKCPLIPIQHITSFAAEASRAPGEKSERGSHERTVDFLLIAIKPINVFRSVLQTVVYVKKPDVLQ